MNNWKKTTLDQIMEIIGGGTPRTSNDKYWNGSIPWLSVVDFNNDSRWVHKTEKSITEKGLNESPTKLLREGDSIISARGTVGELAQLKKPMAFNQSCYGLRANKETTNNFLYYLVRFNLKGIKRNVHGAVFDTITKDTFRDIEVNLPSLPEQKAIARVLWSLDDKIELLGKQNKILEKIAQIIFKEWFVNFNFPTYAKVSAGKPDESEKPYKESGGRMINSELGEILEGWRVGKLEELAKITSGKRPLNKIDKKTSSHRIPLVGATKIMGYVEDYLFNEQLLVIGRVGTHGKIQKFNTKIWPSDNTLVIKSENFSFIYQVLKGIDYGKMNRGAVQPLITQTDLKNYLIVMPMERDLLKFKEIINPITRKIEGNNDQIQTLTKTRDTLLPKLMNREIEINY